jgi:hypothetical protein
MSAASVPADQSRLESKENSCGHSIHPAYALSYDHPRCPPYRLIMNILELRDIDSNINKLYGDVSSWL